jgi:hypothetical protein
MMRKYQHDFFKSALTNATKSKVRGYAFGDSNDMNRTKAFIDKLLLHQIEVYRSGDNFVVPTRQPQYRMVQSMFESYSSYRDSVYYDASAWSVSNFYNMKHRQVTNLNQGERVTSTDNLIRIAPVKKSNYAYVIDYDDYNAVAALNFFQRNKVVVSSAFKPFTSNIDGSAKKFNYGALVVPVSLQKKDADALYGLIQKAQQKFQVPIYALNTGYNVDLDLGSRFVQPLKKPKAAMLIGNGTRSYEAGEIWHLLDTRVHMPITKIPLRNFDKADFNKYNTLVMVSGTYTFTKKQQQKISDWVKKGNTLITIGSASKWAIEKKLIKEKLTDAKSDSTQVDSTKIVKRKPYGDAGENLGKEGVGGIILKADLDITHPLAFGYHDRSIPVYKNNIVWIKPSQNEYSTVAKYATEPHIDGFISKKNMEENLKPSASLIVSKLGSGRVVLFADNPNFRGSWYGTNRLFLNALFLGNKIQVPARD